MQMKLHLLYALQTLLRFSHHGSHLVQYGEYFIYAALIKNSYLHTMTYQCGCNIMVKLCEFSVADGLRLGASLTGIQ